jgi:putative transposase
VVIPADTPSRESIRSAILIYHALNRANARLTVLTNDNGYAAFERVLAEAVARHDMRLLAYCVMPNHFHLVL